MPVEKPFISVMIPTWNRTIPVFEAVGSVREAALDDVEVIVVDNGSDPDVYEALTAGIGHLPFVRLYRNQTNLGMVRNWNRCLEEARGTWVSLLCSDDVFYPNTLAPVRDLLQGAQQPFLLVQDPLIKEQIEIAPPGPRTVQELRLPIASGNFWHRDVVSAVGPFDPRLEYSADVEYWSRIASRFPIVKIRKHIVKYRQHKDNYMWTTWEKPDFLAQIELITRIVAHYRMDSTAPGFAAQVEKDVDEGIWGTLIEIVCRSFPFEEKQHLVQMHVKDLFARTNTPARKAILAQRLHAITSQLKA